MENLKTKSNLPEQDLEHLSRLILDRTGLSFPQSKWSDLQRGVQSLAKVLSLNEEECLQKLLSSANQLYLLDQLTNHLAIKETYFFRDPHVFSVLEEHILPNIIARKRHEMSLSIWSAGCCTGEEAYSLSIALHRILPRIRDWKIRILGTDINPNFIEIAKQGRYKRWSFREPPHWLNKFFTPEGDYFQVLQDIKSPVEFRRHNLRDLDIFPSMVGFENFDLILCRNVFIYFDKEQIKRTTSRFRQILDPEGFLLTGSSENALEYFEGFQQRMYDSVCFYQKKDPVEKITPDFDPLPLLVQTSIVESNFEPAEISHEEIAKNNLLQKMNELFKDNHYLAARSLAMPLLKDPKNASVRIMLAQISANERDLNQAVKWSREAVDIDVLDANAHYVHALILAESGLIKEALKSLGKALYVNPTFALAYFVMGTLQQKEGEKDKARRSFQRTLNLLEKMDGGTVLSGSDNMNVKQLNEIAGKMLARTEENANG